MDETSRHYKEPTEKCIQRHLTRESGDCFRYRGASVRGWGLPRYSATRCPDLTLLWPADLILQQTQPYGRLPSPSQALNRLL